MPIAKINLDKKAQYDAHISKASHLAAPIDRGLEWHIKTDELKGVTCVPGKNYTLSFDVVCTSADDESYRVRQIGKPVIKEGTQLQKLKLKPDRRDNL